MVGWNHSAMKCDALIRDNWGANATIRREAGEVLVAYERTFCRAITTKGERL